MLSFLCLSLVYAERDPFMPVALTQTQTEPLILKTYNLTYTSAEIMASTLEHLYPGILVSADKDIPFIMVRANYNQHVNIKEQLKIIDQPLPQVRIEVQAIELNNNALQDLGVRWYMQDSLKMSEQLSTDEILNRLRLLIGTGKGTLKAAPKITTSLGKPAVIHIGDKVPFTIPIEHGQNTTYEVQYLDAGVVLNITPEHLSTSSIVLNVQPKVNSIKQWKQTIGGEYPILSSREVQTTVRVKTGEALIIGGLIHQEDQTSTQKIPILGDIPIVGFLFQHTTQESVNSDTVFIVTAERI